MDNSKDELANCLRVSTHHSAACAIRSPTGGGDEQTKTQRNEATPSTSDPIRSDPIRCWCTVSGGAIGSLFIEKFARDWIGLVQAVYFIHPTIVDIYPSFYLSTHPSIIIISISACACRSCRLFSVATVRVFLCVLVVWRLKTRNCIRRCGLGMRNESAVEIGAM